MTKLELMTLVAAQIHAAYVKRNDSQFTCETSAREARELVEACERNSPNAGAFRRGPIALESDK